MKKIYVSLLLLLPNFIYADDISEIEQEPVKISEYIIEQKEDTTTEQLQNVAAEDEDEENQERAVFDLDDDDFFGDSLDKMIEMGAVNEEVEVKPMPLWKVWLLQIGSSTLAKLEALKKFISKRYDDAKYIVAMVWAKATGKKIPKRI